MLNHIQPGRDRWTWRGTGNGSSLLSVCYQSFQKVYTYFTRSCVPWGIFLKQIDCNSQLSHRLRNRAPESPRATSIVVAWAQESVLYQACILPSGPFGKGGFWEVSVWRQQGWRGKCVRGVTLQKWWHHLMPMSRLILGSVSLWSSTLGARRWPVRRITGISVRGVEHRASEEVRRGVLEDYILLAEMGRDTKSHFPLDQGSLLSQTGPLPSVTPNSC